MSGTIAKTVAMNKKRKIAIVLILVGFFLPLFLFPLSRTNPLDDILNLDKAGWIVSLIVLYL